MQWTALDARTGGRERQRSQQDGTGPYLSRTAKRSFELNLDAAQRIVRPGAIQVQRWGVSRLPHLSEALALVLGALGTLNRSSGVRTINTEMNGQPVALAMIEGALFGEDTEGNTTLDEIINGE